MFQKGSYDFEYQLAGFIAIESAIVEKSSAVNENKASGEMLDARRKQQLIVITQDLKLHH